MPGESGPAVLVGHRDSDTGPAVFYGLGELAAGDSVVVTDESDHSWRFRVTAVEQFDKDAFPTEKVYGATQGSTLRLLTCAGGFNGDEYEENLVVYAALVQSNTGMTPAAAECTSTRRTGGIGQPGAAAVTHVQHARLMGGPMLW